MILKQFSQKMRAVFSMPSIVFLSFFISVAVANRLQTIHPFRILQPLEIAIYKAHGAEEGIRTLTRISHYPLKIACIPVPPPLLSLKVSLKLF